MLHTPTTRASGEQKSAGEQTSVSRGNQGELPSAYTVLRPSHGVMLQRACACGGTCGDCKDDEAKSGAARKTLQRKATRPSQSLARSEANAAPPIVHDVLRSSGQPLDAATRAFAEPRFGRDFGDVRIHTNDAAAKSARSVNALAYTVGNHIAFDAGRYAPQTGEGRKLLAHELTHVAQQAPFARSTGSGSLKIGESDDRYEREAEAQAERIASAAERPTARIAPHAHPAAPSVQRQADPGKAPTAPGSPAPAGPSCQPMNFVQAKSIADYINLVQCAEAAMPGLSPREFLSFLRQLYYSNEDWSKCKGKGCAFWSDVIPCGRNIPDPRPLLGLFLFSALWASQEVAGTDVGHVFTGLEAMMCPRSDVELNVPGPNWTVSMSNEDFATWGGDVGSAVAQKLYDEFDNGAAPKPWSSYIGSSNTLAGSEDMEGNIDSFAIRKGLLGTGCGATPNAAIGGTITAPMSTLLGDFFTRPTTATGGTRAGRFACFVQSIGGVVAGKSITNKKALVSPISDRVFEFAFDFYRLKFHHAYFASEFAEPLTHHLSTEAATEFLDWLEKQL